MSETIRFRDELERQVAKDPFQAFSLVMVSGDRYAVERSEEITLFEETIILVPLRKRGHSILRANQVISIEVADDV